MSKAVKLKNSLYLSSTSIVHKRGGEWYYLNNLLDNIYPVGSIFISTVNTNPSTYFGGTWEEFGTGRVLVGFDTSQTEFNTLLKTGGSKYTEKHTHNSTVLTRANGNANANTWGELQRSNGNVGNVESKTNTYSSNGYFGSGNSGNLQPYIVVKMWKRVS